MGFPEPTDVGPAAGGDRRVSDSDREHVVRLLTSAAAEGRISVDERDSRLERASQAQIFDDLVVITRDLVQPNDRVSYVPAGEGSGPDSIVAFFGAVERRGHWRVREQISITAIFGGVELDFSEAEFEGRDIEISVLCLFGGVEMRVAKGTSVVNETNAFLGGTDTKVSPPQAGAPRLHITGTTVFGGVEVRNPKSGKKRR